MFCAEPTPCPLSPQHQAPRPSAIPPWVHLPVTSGPHHWFDLPRSNPWAIFASPPPCPVLASPSPIDSSLEMFPELLLAQSCCHSRWPRTRSLGLLSGVQGRAELPFHHRPPPLVPCEWSQPHVPVPPCEASAAAASSLLFLLGIQSPSADPVKFISSHLNPLVRLSLI